MLKKSDWVATALLFAALVAVGFWWQGMERRVAEAAKPLPPLAKSTKPKVLKVPEGGFHEWRVSAADYAKRLPKAKGSRRMPALPEGYTAKADRITISGGGTVKTAITNSGLWCGVYMTWPPTSYAELNPNNDANGTTVAGWTVKQWHAGVYQEDPSHPAGFRIVDGYATTCHGPIGDFIVETGLGAKAWSSEVPVEWSVGPLVLGSKFTCPVPDEGGPALSARHGELRSQWFADESTVVTSTCDGHTVTSNPYTELTRLDVAPGFGWGGSVVNIGVDAGIITDLHLSGWEMDTSGLLDGCLKGFGGGECRLNTSYGSGTSGSAWAIPPVILKYDLGITQFGKIPMAATLRNSVLTVEHRSSVDPDVILQPYFPDGLQTPFNETYVFPIVSWADGLGLVNGYTAGTQSFTLDTDWMEAQDPPLPASDTFVPIRGQPPNGGATYAALFIYLAPSIDVYRPETYHLSSFVTSDPAKLTVADGDASTVFTAKARGGTASRTLVTDWRKYVTKGDAAWSYDTCRITKHVPGVEDVWCWSSHAYLDITFDSGAAQTLQLKLDWVKPVVSDNYISDSTRYDEWGCELTPGSSTYTVRLEAGDDQVVRVNLLFPSEGGPEFLGRIDKVTLSGFAPMASGAPAEIVLKGMSLVSWTDEETGGIAPCYLKIAPGPPVQRGKYSLVSLSHDGASLTLEVPDTEYKQHEVTAYGGSPRYVNPLTGAGEMALILDTQLTIGAIAIDLDRLEGVTASYNKGASDAALADDFTKLGPEYADWLVPVYPHVPNLAPGVSFGVSAAVMCRTLVVTNGIEFTVEVDHALKAGIETQTYEGNAPGPPGIVLQAYYLEGGAKVVDPIASGTTDSNGFAVVSPIPADESRSYGVQQVPA